MLVLDSSGLSALARRSTWSAALITAFRHQGLWPPIVPTIVMAESLAGHAGKDANVNRLLKACDVASHVSVGQARRAAELRARARRGSVVDALVVAAAEPGGTVLTGDVVDLRALAAHAERVAIERT